MGSCAPTEVSEVCSWRVHEHIAACSRAYSREPCGVWRAIVDNDRVS